MFKNKTYKILIFISFFVLLILQSCTDKGVDVQVINNPRNYTWTLDSLNLPTGESTSLVDVWGTNSKDVYALGVVGSNTKKFWHYNGKFWNDITSSLPLQNLNGPQLFKIKGISKNDIWITGSSSSSNSVAQSLVLHYDGVSWIVDNSINGLGISDISMSNNNVWTTDYDNIYKYDALNFIKQKLPSELSQQLKDHQTLNIRSLAATDTSLFSVMTIVNHPNSPFKDKYYFVEFRSNSWVSLDSLIENDIPNWAGKLWYSPSGNLYSFTNNIYKRNGNKWNKIFQTNLRIIKMFGTSDNNIFAVGSGASVYHFNGIDWKKISDLFLPSFSYSGVWTDGAETFIVGTTVISPIKSIIWHGK